MNEYRGLQLNISVTQGNGFADLVCWYTCPEEGTSVSVKQEFQVVEPDDQENVDDWAKQLLVQIVENL